MFEQDVLDVYCYDVPLVGKATSAASLQKEKKIEHPDISVEISGIDYDPVGNDTHRETITLTYQE